MSALGVELTIAKSVETGSEDSDAELIRGALAGADDMFACLMERYRPLIWRIAYRMTLNADDAWDVCQEIAVRLWRTLPKFNREQPFVPWARTIAVREALRWLQQHHSNSCVIEIEKLDSKQVSAWNGGARSSLIAQENNQRITAALVKLSPQQRTAVVLRFYEDLSLSDIAETMDCSEGSVKQHLFRAMEKLRKELKGDFQS